MSVDKLVDSTQLDTDLTSVANAIRTKGGTSAQLTFPAGFVQAIADIPTGGGGAQYTYLKTVTTEADVSSVSIDVDDYDEYFIIANFNLSASGRLNIYSDRVSSGRKIVSGPTNTAFTNAAIYIAYIPAQEVNNISISGGAYGRYNASGAARTEEYPKTPIILAPNTSGQTILSGATFAVYGR